MIYLKSKNCEFQFTDAGAVFILVDGIDDYFNSKPIYVSVKDISAVSTFREVPYESVEGVGEGQPRNPDSKLISYVYDCVVATGTITSNNGSEFKFTDTYKAIDDDVVINRKVTVISKSVKDLGFQTKIGFSMAGGMVHDYDYFSPGEWYKNNEYAAFEAQGKNMQCNYYWRKETYSGLPMFAMQNKKNGETICFSRYKADVQLPTLTSMASENFVDPKATVGALGVSIPTSEALLYTYYSAPLRKELDIHTNGLFIDYIYPGTNGEIPTAAIGPVSTEQPMSMKRTNHPVEVGFTQDYTIAVNIDFYPNFQTMMKKTWRHVYARLKDELVDISNEELFENNMKLLTQVTNEYNPGVWGTPFAAQLPQFDPNSTSAEMGFVGQQTGIGYQLIRWGTIKGEEEAIIKGKGIIDFWVNKTMTDIGCPRVWYHLGMDQFEPQPIWIRQIGDGLEGILDAYVFLHNRGEEHSDWLDYCIKTADWLCDNQNEDGSFYRSYNYDGSMCMDSKANTPSVVRFLVLMKVVTGQDRYEEAAYRAGVWTFDNLYVDMEYRGGTCDNADIQDKEAGIYALFAFLALYDLRGEDIWIEAACGAADYVETFTYMWNYPIATNFPTMPFNTHRISGQSHITVGSGAADVYMACGSYVYYRLYLITGDEHYRDYAEFIHLNTKQANDIDGSLGAAIPGLVHESGFFCEQLYQGNYHWLPWCTFVEVDPVSRMLDTFGVYEIADADKIPMEERQKMNRVLENYIWD